MILGFEGLIDPSTVIFILLLGHVSQNPLTQLKRTPYKSSTDFFYVFFSSLTKVSHLQRKLLLWVMKKSYPREVICRLVSDTVCSLVKVGSWYVYLHMAFKQALSLRIARLEGWYANSEKSPDLSRLNRAA